MERGYDVVGSLEYTSHSVADATMTVTWREGVRMVRYLFRTLSYPLLFVAYVADVISQVFFKISCRTMDTRDYLWSKGREQYPWTCEACGCHVQDEGDGTCLNCTHIEGDPIPPIPNYYPLLDPVCLIHGLRQSEHRLGRCLYCCLCFKTLTLEECYVLPNGLREDVCDDCVRLEAEAHNRDTDKH